MAQEIEITINEADLGRADREFGLDKDDLKLFDADGKTSVNVFVDGERASLARRTTQIDHCQSAKPRRQKVFCCRDRKRWRNPRTCCGMKETRRYRLRIPRTTSRP